MLVFPPGNDPEESAIRAEDLADDMGSACEGRLLAKDGLPGNEIRLMRCLAVCEDDLPVSRARVLMQWRLEHLSLRADDGQPGPPT